MNKLLGDLRKGREYSYDPQVMTVVFREAYAGQKTEIPGPKGLHR